jgi:hypothetical protein
MADTTIYVRDVATGQTLPLKLVDNLDGTYSLGPSGGEASQATLLLVKTGVDAIVTSLGGKQTLSAANDTVTAGLYDATTLSAVDTDLATGNIKSGVTIFGFAGSTNVRDSSDATAVAGEVKTGSTFYAGGGAKKTGTGTQTLSDASDTVTAGYYAATTLHAVDSDLATANIKAGVTVFGIAGKTEVVDTTEVTNPVVAARMKTNDVAFVNGTKITGSGTKALDPASATVAAGYYAATTLDAVDTDLVTGSIKSGVTIFGVAGAATVQDIADANATETDVALGKTFYSITGAKKTGTHV